MTTTPSRRPTHKLYSVARLRDGKSSWTEIGAAWAHKDGNGFSFKMTAMPAPGGEFMMRADRPRPVATAE
jgi:hypothetical protein